jgi:hypothetical protein
MPAIHRKSLIWLFSTSPSKTTIQIAVDSNLDTLPCAHRIIAQLPGGTLYASHYALSLGPAVFQPRMP